MDSVTNNIYYVSRILADMISYLRARSGMNKQKSEIQDYICISNASVGVFLFHYLFRKIHGIMEDLYKKPPDILELEFYARSNIRSRLSNFRKNYIERHFIHQQLPFYFRY
jgi:hypothetical protein